MRRASAVPFRSFLPLAFLGVVLGALLFPHACASPLVVDVANRGGTLKKAGLGSLFGAANIAGGTSATRLQDSLLFVAQSQGRIGENGSNPYSTEAVAPVIRGTGVKMMCRFNDLCYGWPYAWLGYHEWINQVTVATQAIKNNYSDVVYGIAIFNEPDAQLYGTDFMNDPLVGGGTNHDARINWLWTQTYQVIRGIAPDIKIMGPNWFDYRPQADAAHQTRMVNFMNNAVATNTVPDIMGWHSLVFGNPADVTIALNNYYRPLEASLGISPRPISIEEYGINNGAFEGIPGQMVRYWGEFERAGIDFACMGIYENGGSIGNTLRYGWDNPPKPNAGWHVLNWYRGMAGVRVPVIRSTFDGMASWDAATSKLTVVCGGTAENAIVQINGLSGLGMGSQVRVRLERAEWTTNTNVANTAANQGGDPMTQPVTILDRTYTLDGSGNLAVPVRMENNLDGHRIIVSPVAVPAAQTDKYEAELASLQNVNLVTGTVANPRCSNYSYVGGIDFANSQVAFNVTVPSTGLYRMQVRYAAALGAATHVLTVNGSSQATVDYPGTAGGWSNNELRSVSRLVSLVAGTNVITFGKGSSYAELDYISLRPDSHRYEAKLATVNNVTLGKYANMFMVPDFVGGINDATSHVEFSVEAPVAGTYQMDLTYGNGTASNAVDSVTLNGAASGNVTLLPTGGWLSAAGGPGPKRKVVKIVRTLAAGWNTVRLQKVSGFAELDFMTVAPYVPETLAQPVWTGTVDGKWDFITENWKDASSGNSGLFTNGTPAVFDDSATGSTTLTLSTAVSPASVVFNHSTKPYNLSGGGAIAGSTGLLKQGGQPLTLSTPNTYLGATTLSGGVTTAANLAHGGVPSAIGASSSAASSLVLNGGTLAYNGSATAIDRGFTLAGSNSGISVVNSLAMGGPVVTSGGNLIKSGVGELRLTRDGPLVLGSVSPGVRVQQGTLTLAGAGAQAVNVGGEMFVGNVPDSSADLTLENTSLSVATFLALGRGNGDTGVVHLNATASQIQTGSFSTGYANGLPNNASEQFVLLTNSIWTNSGVTYLAESSGSTSEMTLAGGSQYNASGNLLLSRFGGTTSTLTLKDNSRVTLSGGYTSIGGSGNGTLIVRDNATFTATPNADFNVSDIGSSSGTIHLSGAGTVSATQVYIGKNSGTTGTVNQTGGSFRSTSFISIGRFSGGTGAVNVSGGTFYQDGVTQPFYVGEQGTGVLTLSASGNVLASGTALLIGGGGMGTVNLDGGVLQARRVAEGSGGTSRFHFNGGLLKAISGANPDFMSGIDLATVKAGGARIDSNGQNLAISQPLLDGGSGGGLVKSGNGTLSLNASNSFLGTTTVNQGRLGGTGSVAGPLEVATGASIAPGNGVGSFASGAATLAGSYVCEVNGATADKLVVNGPLTLVPGAILDLDLISPPSLPVLVIASYTSLSGSFTVQDLPQGYVIDLHYHNGIDSNNIALVSAPFASWASLKITSIDPAADASEIGDPDGDGLNNLSEFAFDDEPLSGAASGKLVGKIALVATEPTLVLTLPVRTGATFSGATAQVSAPVSGITYQIEAGDGLIFWNYPVTEITGPDKVAIEAGLPALSGDAWQYRSFASPTGNPPLQSREFIRAAVAAP